MVRGTSGLSGALKSDAGRDAMGSSLDEIKRRLRKVLQQPPSTLAAQRLYGGRGGSKLI
jgi:hypothetical protein